MSDKQEATVGGFFSWLATVRVQYVTLAALIGLGATAGVFVWESSGLQQEVHQTYSTATNVASRLDQLGIRESDHYRADGLIATFLASPPQDITTDCREQLSLMSDSAHGGTSTVWYEQCLCEPSKGPDSQSYLRIHYHLNPTRASEPVPYVGVFGYFSSPPRVFSLTRFKGVELKARAGDTNGCEFFFQLCDANAAEDRKNAWAETKLHLRVGASNTALWPDGERDSDKRAEQFTEFKTPSWHPVIPFDQSRVFGFTLVIRARAGHEACGSLDVTEIRFK
jgi:hypothetical protein